MYTKKIAAAVRSEFRNENLYTYFEPLLSDKKEAKNMAS
jgi:hypothetical protein